MTLFALAMLPFAAAVLVALLPNERKGAAALIAGATAIAGLILLAGHAGSVFSGHVPAVAVPWLPFSGADFGFRLDGLAFAFALLIYGIGALIVLYAYYYLHDEPYARFFSFLLAFMGAMLGVVLADNLILLVVFWELTSITSFLLIGFWRDRADARQGARMALTITGAGGLCLLAGIVLIGHIVGSYKLDAVFAAKTMLAAHAWFPAALILVLLGALTKSAQFPFHFWLPHAMAAPTPVSAFLHSATMVKAGVFLLARLYPVLSGNEWWFWIVGTCGLATLVLGAAFALFQHDLKGLLAYSTVSHLGLITLLLGMQSDLALVAAVFHILNHATFKASLFMAAGIIDHESGTRDMRKLNGLMKLMPVTATLAMVASAAMAGVPLMNGFLSKEMFFAETLFFEGHFLLEVGTPLGATVAAVLSVAYSLRFIHDVFFNGEPVGLTKTPREPPRWMRFPVELLVVLCLVVGLAPAVVIGPLLAVAAKAALGGPLPEYSLAIWHGFNLPLLMSVIALFGGTALYFVLQKRVNLHTVDIGSGAGRRSFDVGLRALTAFAARVTAITVNGRLQSTLFWVFAAALLALLYPILSADAVRMLKLSPVPIPVVLIALLGVAVTIGTVMCYRERLTALLMMGAVGLVVALTFVYFSAPDLALTQVLVEAVTVILMMLALYYLPKTSPDDGAHPIKLPVKLRDGALALAIGGAVMWLVWQVLSASPPSISPYFLEKTVPEGGGANAVNVIIVDFRGYDTLGEITVLGIAGLLVAMLLSGQSRLRVQQHAPARASSRHPLMLQVISRLLLPLMLLVSVFLFLRGHNQPGGGFIAGLVAALALILQYVASGNEWASARIPQRFHAVIAWGLLIAGLTGVGSVVVGHPFLTSSFTYPELPLIGKIPIASAMFFDLGVFLVVVGATMLALAQLARLHAAPTDVTRGAG